jgi:hypothetical protein
MDEAREEKVVAKKKGEIQTYWVAVRFRRTGSERTCQPGETEDEHGKYTQFDKIQGNFNSLIAKTARLSIMECRRSGQSSETGPRAKGWHQCRAMGRETTSHAVKTVLEEVKDHPSSTFGHSKYRRMLSWTLWFSISWKIT